ncbi:flagellar M-ring protein FliF [Chitinibacter bivalviorum]|uniref:Flagellar M-ring protein n=1 Tax=Chitinibacter bivalviorum TaxID=2739434 RepID=A0A7H9BL03_9NEIS|nr:flagellar basal-body MS-ring/collar protein FliF [Chitinibacter bivalviorum]QLG88084.1 flagellar M-ring protein FliF [Chitinibacter bivalviorum]
MAEAGVAADNTLVTARNIGGLRQRFDALPAARKMMAMVMVAVIVAAAIGGLLWSKEPAYRILFTNLPDKDGGAIVQSLQQMNIPYKLDAGMISVPAQNIYDVRLKLAAQGLPKAGNTGFELLDNQKFGVSQFAEQVNYQRAIEGELVRSIESISAVEKARVHLATPKQTVFLRDQQKPSASVVLMLHPGRVLDGGQIAGIIHLVSSSIPGLPVSNVTVVDQDGNLLSRSADLNARGSLDQRQLQYISQIERGYVERLEAILAPIVGKDNVRAEVTAQLDFSEVEQTSETFKPNSPPNSAAIRSQQTLDQSGKTAEDAAMGVPGALSNQPPGAAAAPITAPIASGASGAAAVSSNTRKEATLNYEVDKTIQHVKQPIGIVKRLSAAVVLNYKAGKDKEGKVAYVPFTPAEMVQINNLVRESIGYNKERGDSINVVNAAFAESMPLEDKPLPDKALNYIQANAIDVLKMLVIGIASLYLLFFVVRPLMKDLTRSREESRTLELDLGEAGGGVFSLESGGSGDESPEEQNKMAAFADLLQQAKELAKNDPRMVATILREWMTAASDDKSNPNKVS